jgi:hypothetical protein
MSPLNDVARYMKGKGFFSMYTLVDMGYERSEASRIVGQLSRSKKYVTEKKIGKSERNQPLIYVRVVEIPVKVKKPKMDFNKDLLSWFLYGMKPTSGRERLETMRD